MVQTRMWPGIGVILESYEEDSNMVKARTLENHIFQFSGVRREEGWFAEE